MRVSKVRCTCVDDFLNKAFFKIGLIVGRHPGYFVIVPFLLACICLTGYQQIRYEIDPEYLFSPLDGPGKTERAIVEEHFRVNYSDRFSIARITRPGRFGHVVVIAKDNDTNILRSAVFKELRQLDDLIRNTTAVYDGESYTYSKICAKWLGECATNDILELDQIIEEVEKKEMNLTFPITFNPATFDVHIMPAFLGGSVLGEDMVIESAPAIQMGYFVVVDNPKQDLIGAAWEEAFLDAVGEAENGGFFKHISVARFASRTLELEFEANTQTVIPYYLSTFTIMALFSVITCMMSDWVRSKPWLGLLGNVSAGMSVTAAFGLCCYLGVDFIGINLAAPFLMIGIGIDDTFVMLAAWRRTNIMDPVPLRMAHTLSEAAVSITITSVTDMVSFFIGIISPFPSVQIFCIYSGFACCFTFVFHLTFFAGCVAISGYCEQKNLHSVVCVPVQPLSKSGHRSWLYRMFCTGGLDPANPDHPLDNPEHGCMSWFRDYLAVALNKPWVKIIVVIAFAFYLAGGMYGLTQLEEGLDRRKLSKADSYSVEFYNREDTYYREFPYRIQVIISGQYDYSDPIIQQQVENLTLSLEASKWIGSGIYTESWLRSFLASLEDLKEEEDFNYNVTDEKSFIEVLREKWLFPRTTWALDVKFDNKSEHILASRFMIQAVNVSGTNNEKDMVRELRKICADSPLNATVFHPYFVFFDQFELIMPTSIQCLTYGAGVMMIISFIFIPNVLCSLWVAFCIISIEIGVAGYMAMWDISLDSISMINLIMCIGFSIDFTAHICYAYMSSKHKRPDDRVKECLYTLGLPIVQGSSSTIIGLFALVLADTYIFLVFFKMVFLVIFFGALHGLLLLPVLLSVFGPGSCTNFDKEDELEKAKDLAKLPKPYVIPHPTLFYGKGKDMSPGVSLAALEDKDLGLGTSEDSNSTESGSSQSRRKDRTSEQEDQNKTHYQDWRRSLGMLQGLSQFQTTSPPPDYPGAHALDNQQDRNHRNSAFLHNTTRIPSTRLNNNKEDSRRSRSQQNLHQSPTGYFNNHQYP